MTEEVWLPIIDQTRCTGCGDCIATCPTNALGLVGGAAVITEPAACNYCAECETICPVEAIALPYQVVLEANL
jgi:NAD-dependent dihydropyrimidine dehydrogenase PreA subunit